VPTPAGTHPLREGNMTSCVHADRFSHFAPVYGLLSSSVEIMRIQEQRRKRAEAENGGIMDIHLQLKDTGLNLRFLE
jgi:hypothetical protein